jgi:hypothetical protein
MKKRYENSAVVKASLKIADSMVSMKLSQALLVKLSAVRPLDSNDSRLETWNILAGEFVWASTLFLLVQRVAHFPASEALRAQEDNIAGTLHSLLIVGRHVARASDGTLLNRRRMTM